MSTTASRRETPRAPPQAPGAVRRVGGAEWTQERGLQPDKSEPLRLRGEALQIGSIGLSRISYPPVDLTRTALAINPGPGPEDSAMDSSGAAGDQLIIGALVEGATTYYRGGEEHHMTPNTALVFRRSDLWSMNNTVPITAMSVLISGSVLHRHNLLPEPGSEPFLLNQAHVMALLSFSDFAFRHSHAIGGIDSPYFRRTAENLVVGLIRDATGAVTADSTTAEYRLYRQAMVIIVAGSSSPDLTVPTLARKLNVSERHLQRAFAAAGSSPLIGIRAARVTHALGQFDDDDDDLTRADVEKIAARCGFRSTRALNSALRDHGHPTR